MTTVKKTLSLIRYSFTLINSKQSKKKIMKATTVNNSANVAIYLSVFFLISLVTIFCYFNPSLLK